VCRLRGAAIQSEVIPAGRFQAFMAQDFFDVPNRTSIEQQLGRGSVS
jgi:hypothetical protein